MSAEPRGTIDRTYQNADRQTVAVIKWTRGQGPLTVIGDYRSGQMVTQVGGKVRPA